MQDYFTKYPNGQYADYQIVYKTVGEHAPDEFSYLIVFTRNQGLHDNTVSFYEFLKSYCICADRCAATLGNGRVLPQLDGREHIFGKPKKPT